MKAILGILDGGTPAADDATRPAGTAATRHTAFRDALGRALGHGAPAAHAHPTAGGGASAGESPAEVDSAPAAHAAEARAAKSERRPRTRPGVKDEQGSERDIAEASAAQAQGTPGSHAAHQVASAHAAQHTVAHAARPAEASTSSGPGTEHGTRAPQAARTSPLARASAAAAAGLRLPASARPAANAQDKGKAAQERERVKEREKEPSHRTPEAAGAASREAPPAAPAPGFTQEARSGAPRAAQAAAPAAPALPPAPAGQEVQGAVLRQAAHIRVDAGGLGALELHLRVREGALHLRVDGEAARAVEARAGELSRALAGEGLKLGTIEGPPPESGSRAEDGGGRGAGERRDAWQEARDGRDAPAPPPSPARPGAVERALDRGVHVKA